VDAAVARAVERLTASRARDELLATVVERRIRGAAFAPVERVWRLGVLLLGHSGTLYATGTTFLVDELKHPNQQSNLAAARRQYRSMALKAGIRPGETVNFDAPPIDLDHPAGPVIRTADGLEVRWSAASTAGTPFEAYLAERVDLLADPPNGA
jgi:hypothetical protein